MSELVIEITAAGKVEAMHSDAFDLGFLGRREVRRQTEIMFNDTTQKWDIIYIDEEGTYHPDDAVSGFDGYEEARALEVAWVNACRLHSIRPATTIGFAVALWLRTAEPGSCFTLPVGDCIASDCMHTALA